MPVFREALGSAWRGNLFWLNVGCRDMWGVLCGESLVEPKEASMSPLPQLWINHPQSVKDHLCFIPVCMMETETLNGLAWLEFGWGTARASHMDSYLKPLWKCNLKGEVWQCHQCRRTMPKLKCWHYKAFRDLIHNSTDENKLCSQTSRKEMSKQVISSFNLVLSFGSCFYAEIHQLCPYILKKTFMIIFSFAPFYLSGLLSTLALSTLPTVLICQSAPFSLSSLSSMAPEPVGQNHLSATEEGQLDMLPPLQRWISTVPCLRTKTPSSHARHTLSLL